MPVQQPILSNFTSGEWSPKMNGRVDLEKYFNACEKLENFVLFPQGGVERRGGTRFINEVKTNSSAVRLVNFEFSVSQAYVLEFGNNYIRVYKDLGVVVSGGSPVEISTTYTSAQLDDLQFTQSADTLYITHKDHYPSSLTRSSHTSWTLSNLAWSPAGSEPSEWTSGNYPQVVTFYEQRLWFAATPNEPQTLWASKSGDYTNMTQGSADDDALEYTIATDQVNAIRWLNPGKVLVIGTAGGEFIASASSLDEALTPTNVKIVRQSNYGSAFLPSIRLSDTVLYVQRASRKLRQFIYAFESDSYVSTDLTLLADHITESGIKDMTRQSVPNEIIWAVLEDGSLVSLSYLREQKVLAWAKHPFTGTDTSIESLTSIPSSEGIPFEEVWISVKRTIDGSTKRYIEVLRSGLSPTSAIEDSFYTDSGLSYEGSPVSSVSGLDHLEGETVSVLVDGTVHEDKVVTGGVIALNGSYSKVHAGLSFTSKLKTMNLEFAAPSGNTAQGKIKRISRVTVRFLRSLGGAIGSQEGNTDVFSFRSSADSMDSSVGLFTGDITVPFRGGHETEGQIYLEQSQPLPFTVLSLMPKVKTNME